MKVIMIWIQKEPFMHQYLDRNDKRHDINCDVAAADNDDEIMITMK